jgi:methionyl-tRNA synthetase
MAEQYEVDYGVQDQAEIIASDEAIKYFGLINNFKFNEAMDWLWSELGALDEYIATEEPFKTIKTNEVKAKADVAYCAIRLHELAVLLQPALPDTAQKIMHAIDERAKPDNLFPRK